jgi:hypothetical protein
MTLQSAVQLADNRKPNRLISEEDRKAIKRLIGNYRHYDKKRFGTNESTVTYEDWLELYIEQGGKCFWSGKQMTVCKGLPTDASLDRIHCDLPHTRENCVLVHKSLNLGRNDTSLADWIEYLYTMGWLAADLAKEYESLQ